MGEEEPAGEGEQGKGAFGVGGREEETCWREDVEDGGSKGPGCVVGPNLLGKVVEGVSREKVSCVGEDDGCERDQRRE